MDGEPRQPILIIGMQHSGTSLIARTLEKLGLFLGWRRKGGAESRFFLRLNDWLLRQCGARWDHPGPMRDLIANEPIRALVSDYLHRTLEAPRAVSYLGPWRYLRLRSLFRVPFPWGWKDPRSTFTLSLWADLFPRLRVVHVFRHGADVARSLQVRQARLLVEARRIYRRREPLYRFAARSSGFTDTLRCTTLEGGFSLWEEYLRAARAHVAALGDRAVEIHYPDAVSRPEEVLERLIPFCGLEPPPEAVRRPVLEMLSRHGGIRKEDPELQRFTDQMSGRLEALGFHPQAARSSQQA